MSDVRYFSKVKQTEFESIPNGMSVVEWSRMKEAQETERYLNRNESVRVPVQDNEELATLFRRGDLVKASELEAKRLAEEKAQRQFDDSVELEGRNQRFQKPRPTAKSTSVIWTREKVEE